MTTNPLKTTIRTLKLKIDQKTSEEFEYDNFCVLLSGRSLIAAAHDFW
jgi:hypothetical protein